ncbi:hypothetical protein ABPG74_019014 [Tetrahymena malaccensis]
MERHTLRFKSKNLEKEYQEQTRKSNIIIFIQLSYYYMGIVSIPNFIMSIVQSELYILIFSIVSIICLVMLIQILKRIPKYYNYYINMLQLFITSIYGYLMYYLGPQLKLSDPYALFFYSAQIFQIQMILFFFNENFLSQIFQVAFKLSVFLVVTWRSEIYPIKYNYLVLNIFIVVFLFKSYSCKKESFSLKQSEKQWAKVVKFGLSTSIMTVKYDQKQNFITLDIVNQHAQKIFQVSTNDSFKMFSRAVKVYPSVKMSERDELPSSLENKIIEYIKAFIEFHKRDKLQKGQKGRNNKNNNIRPKNQSLTAGELSSQKQNAILLYSTYQRYESEEPQKYKIKLSTYFNQNCYHCCIELEEEKDQQKIRNLQIAKNHIEQKFYIMCLKMGEKLSKIEHNISNKYLILSNIRMAQVQLQNIHDHAKLKKKQLNNENPQNFSDTTVGDIVQHIQESFYQAIEQKMIQFTFENCNKNTPLHTLNSRFQQILHNFIENSIRAIQISLIEQKTKNQEISRRVSTIQTAFKFQKQKQQISSKQQNSNAPPLEQEEQTGTSPLLSHRDQDRDRARKLTFNNSNHQYFYQIINKTQKSNTNLSANLIPPPQLFNLESSKLDVQQKETIKDQLQDRSISKLTANLQKDTSEFQLNATTIAQKQKINIKFQLLEGSNNMSNILKISIQDNGLILQQTKLLAILKEIGDAEKDENYQQFKYLGWKVNQDLIGRIGPYHDFFAQVCMPKGIEVHFYIYQNLKITIEANKNIPFDNYKFVDQLNISKSNYYSTFSKHLLNNVEEINIEDVRESQQSKFRPRQISQFQNNKNEDSPNIQSSQIDEKLKDQQNSEILKSSTQIALDSSAANKIYTDLNYKVSLMKMNTLLKKSSLLESSNNQTKNYIFRQVSDNYQSKHINKTDLNTNNTNTNFNRLQSNVTGDDTTRPIYLNNEFDHSTLYN